MDHKAPEAFRSISEVADELDLPQHVLRFLGKPFPRHQADEARRRAALLSSRRRQSSARHPPSSVRRGLHHPRRAAHLARAGREIRRGRLAGRRAAAAAWRDAKTRISPKKRHRRRPRPPTRRAVCGSRLSALIGRDLGDRADDARGAPRAAAQERAGAAHRADRSRDPWRCGRASVCHATGARCSGGAGRRRRPARLAREDLHKLHAVLHELGECRKLIDAAVARAE